MQSDFNSNLETLQVCPLCGSKDFFVIGDIMHKAGKKYSGSVLNFDFKSNLVSCDHCNSKFISPRLSENYTKKIYADSPATRWVPERVREIESIDSLYCNYTPSGFKKIFKKHLLENNNEKMNVLDVGCFNGNLLDIFSFYKFQTFGIDLNKESVAKIGNRHKVLFGDINVAKQFKTQFDIITAFDVIEHIYNLDVFWKNVYENLNRDGLCVLLTGNPNALGVKIFKNKWWYFQYPEHIVFPSAKYYKSLEKNYNLKMVKIYYLHHRSLYKLPITDHVLVILQKI